MVIEEDEIEETEKLIMVYIKKSDALIWKRKILESFPDANVRAFEHMASVQRFFSARGDTLYASESGALADTIGTFISDLEPELIPITLKIQELLYKTESGDKSFTFICVG